MIKLLRTSLLATFIFSNSLNIRYIRPEQAAFKNFGTGSLLGSAITLGACYKVLPLLPTFSKIAAYLYIATKGSALIASIFLDENNGVINNSSALIGLMVGSGIVLAIRNMDENDEQIPSTHVLISNEALEELQRRVRNADNNSEPAPVETCPEQEESENGLEPDGTRRPRG